MNDSTSRAVPRPDHVATTTATLEPCSDDEPSGVHHLNCPVWQSADPADDCTCEPTERSTT